jgi:uncharacterized membrane-anchored protein
MHPDALGRPGEGVHFHVGGVAIVDLGLTAVAAWALARWWGVSFWAVFAGLMALGLAVHRWVGVRTRLTKLFGG